MSVKRGQVPFLVAFAESVHYTAEVAVARKFVLLSEVFLQTFDVE